jgi:hypothetical protein
MSVEIAVPDELIQTIAERAAERAVELLVERGQPEAEPWLDVRGAAEHMSVSVSQIYTLISQRRRNGIPVTAEGSRRYFKASALDAWRLNNDNGGSR